MGDPLSPGTGLQGLGRVLKAPTGSWVSEMRPGSSSGREGMSRWLAEERWEAGSLYLDDGFLLTVTGPKPSLGAGEAGTPEIGLCRESLHSERGWGSQRRWRP